MYRRHLVRTRRPRSHAASGARDDAFRPAADYEGERHASAIVTSPWGIGILELSGSTLTARMMAPNGTRFGEWLLNTADNEF